MGILSLFFSVPPFYFPLPVCVTPYLSVSGRPVHTVFSGRRSLPSIPRSCSLLSSRTGVFFHPSRVVLVTFRFTARVLVLVCSAPVFSPVLAAHCSIRLPHCTMTNVQSSVNKYRTCTHSSPPIGGSMSGGVCDVSQVVRTGNSLQLLRVSITLFNADVKRRKTLVLFVK